jgi:YD repeat-containing protein
VNGSGSSLDRYQYGYDRVGIRLHREKLVDSTRSELNGYDALNRLTSFARGTLNGTKDAISGMASRSQGWDFDALGNWDSVTTDSSTQSRTANKRNEITSISGSTTPTYDANGNLTTDETGRTFKYDAWNRLVEVRDSSNTLLATFRYDGLGQRVRETRGGVTKDLYYSAAGQVLEERVDGAAQAQYVWSPGYVDALVEGDRDTDANGSLDERLYAAHDGNFDVTALIDTSGNVVERYVYDPYGQASVLTSAWGSRSSSSYGWTRLHQGLEYVGEIGLYADRG